MGRYRAVVGVTVGTWLACGTARAEQFLGVEQPGAAAPAASTASSPAPAQSVAPAEKKAPAPRAAASEDQDEHLLGDWSLSGGFGVGPGYEEGEATVGYSLSRYVGIDTSYTYFRLDQAANAGQEYGPELDLVLRLPIKSILIPYVGAGPGYLKWTRQYDGQVFDEGAAPTGNAFGGLDIRLTRHFGIQVERRQQTWLGPPPKRFSDRQTPEARSTVASRIGFHMMI